MGFWQTAQDVIIDIVETVAFSLVIFLLVVVFLVQPHRVDGSSMVPTFFDEEIILTNKIAYRFEPVSRGDIIIFHAPKDPKKDFIKRVIGLPKEQIRLKDGKLFVNQQPLSEPYLQQKTTSGVYLQEGGEIIVPDDSYFVMGDNRAASSDSRTWGPVPRQNIIGKAWLLYWPPKRLRFVEHLDY